MSAPINRNTLSKALWPGVNKWYGEEYAKYPEEYLNLFDKNTSSKAFEEDVGLTGFGLAAVINEGGNVQYDTFQQGFITRYTHVKYGLGFIVTQEAIDDDQYMLIAQKRAKALAFSMRHTKENVAALVYDRAFSSTYTGGDGKELCATDHPNVNGGTYANEPTTAADLSEAALEQAVIDISKMTNDRGLKIALMPVSLIIPSDLMFEADRILKSPLQAGNSNNDINALKMGGWIPKVVVNHYLSDTDAWFLRTNAPDGMKYFERMADKFAEDKDFDSDNLKYKAVARYSFGWTDPKGIYGSPGA